MAIINGTVHAVYTPWFQLVQSDDLLRGTPDGDQIYGYGGADTIYAGGGSDYVDGGPGNDMIYAGAYGDPTYLHFGGLPTQHYGFDTVLGGGGVDYIDYSWSADKVTIYGDGLTPDPSDGSDTIHGSQGADHIYGGGGGYNNLWGEGGSDTIVGNDGVGDFIVGGSGVDFMTGGSGYDEFYFNNINDTGTSFATADVITDFWKDDQISMWHAGTASNFYGHGFSHISNLVDDFNAARSQAETDLAQMPAKSFIYLTNGVNGYLFADVNYDHHFDQAVELRGLNAVSEFNWNNLV